MKKIISVLLALVMMFSLVTVAFVASAEEETPDETTTTTEAQGEDATDEDTSGGFNIEDMPLWQLKLILKGGKIVLKFAKGVLKIAIAFGLVDLADILRTIIDYITAAQGGDTEEPSASEPTEEPSSEAIEEPVAA